MLASARAFLAALLAMILLSALPQSAQALTVSGAKCSDLIVLGARGSGQRWDSGAIEGFGPEVSGAVQNAVARVKASGTVRFVGVTYPAIPIDNSWTRGRYFNSVGEGARYTMSVVNALAQECPLRTRFALVGYSQGASVMRWAIRDLPDSRKDRVVAVGLIADPERRGFNVSPSEIGLIENYDTGTLHGSGVLGAAPVLPSRRANAIVTMCHRGDNVCNFPVNSGWAIGDWIRFEYRKQVTHSTFYKSTTGISSSGLMLYIPLSKHGFR